MATHRSIFDQYIEELQELPRLDAREELTLAREIERLVVAHWSALLAYTPARAVIISAVEAAPQVGASFAPLAKARVRVKASELARIARELQRLDRDCEALAAADAAVQEAFAHSAGATLYLQRVARARDAQLQAKARFVTANLRLVIALARRYEGGLMALPDLIQEGNLGLMRAVARFDYRRGFRFSTYAAWWIRHALNRGLSDKGRTVRVPVHALDDVARIKRAIAASQKATGLSPSDDDLASATGISAGKVSLLRAYAGSPEPVSLDKSLGDDRERTLHDVLPANDTSDPDRDIDLGHWRAELSELLKDLSSIEATTLRLRFGLDGADEISLREIGAKYNLSRERIRQIQVEALGKLRAALHSKQRQRAANLAA